MNNYTLTDEMGTLTWTFCPLCGCRYMGPVHTCPTFVSLTWTIAPSWTPVAAPRTLEDRVAELEAKVARLEERRG